jgi:hypothetical protein
MGLPYNIRVNVNVPFPSLVAGGSAIKVTKKNGIWTISIDYGEFVLSPTIADPANSYVLIWNAVSGLFSTVPVSSVSGSKVVTSLTGVMPFTTPYAAQTNDEVLLVGVVPFTVTVDWSTRTKSLRIVDATGSASTATPITITPAAGQTQLATVNYSYIIDGAGGSITLTPLPNGSGAY